MDVLSLVDPKFVDVENDPAYWLGAIGWAAAHAVSQMERDPVWARSQLRRTLERYMESPSCPAETRRTLREEMR